MATNVSEIRRDIEKTLGFVPGFLKEVTYENPEAESLWNLMKHYDIEESNIPPKYKHLICYAVAAAIHCPYCTPFHKLAAEMNGATEAELREASLHAFKTAGFSSFLHGRQYPLERFNEDLDHLKENMQKMTGKR